MRQMTVKAVLCEEEVMPNKEQIVAMGDIKPFAMLAKT
jgi:hypothetical protein